MRYGFDELGLSAIDLLVLDFNERAQRCYRACGFGKSSVSPRTSWTTTVPPRTFE
jgi:RimJ/RimL family protein N-acetyltransferase